MLTQKNEIIGYILPLSARPFLKPHLWNYRWPGEREVWKSSADRKSEFWNRLSVGSLTLLRHRMYLHEEKGKPKVSMCAPFLSNCFWEPKGTLRQAQSLKSKSLETQMGGALCVKMCSSILPYKAVVSFYAESTSVGFIEIWALLIICSCPPPQFCYKLYHRSGLSCNPEWGFLMSFSWQFLQLVCKSCCEYALLKDKE